MADELVTALLRESGLRVVVVTAGELAREGRRLQRAKGAAAALFSQALVGGLLVGALQKGRARIHLQIECDGPLRGVFVDANAEGHVRGYVKNPQVSWEGEAGAFRWRPALGNSGFLSVLRDLGGGEYYRSAVELVHFDLGQDLQRYFKTSEQLETVLSLTALADAGEPLARVAGVLIQPLPEGDREALERLALRLEGEKGLRGALGGTPAPSAPALLRTLFPEADLEVMSRLPARYSCGCSRERVHRALLAMGRAELQDMLAKEGQAEVTCEFCSTQYLVTGDEIRGLLQPS
jgi:molecular chaperone Hsp33